MAEVWVTEATPKPDVDIAVEFAMTAPSPRNILPWIVTKVSPDVLEISRDWSKRRDIADPRGRELTISCGVALGFAETALQSMGAEYEIDLIPEPASRGVLASIQIIRHGDAERQAGEDAIAALLRHSSWTQFAREPVSAAAAGVLIEAGCATTVVTELIERTVQVQVDELIAAADEEQLADPAFLAELAHLPQGRPSLQSIPGKPWMFERHRAPFGGGSLFVLSTHDDVEAEWLALGRSLAKFLEAALRLDLNVTFANQPLQLPVFRARVRDLVFPSYHPQQILRVGRAAEADSEASFTSQQQQAR